MKNLFGFGIQVLKRFGKTNASTILSLATTISPASKENAKRYQCLPEDSMFL